MTESVNQTQTPASKSINMGGWISQAWNMVFSEFGPILLLSIIYLVALTVASSTVIGTFVLGGPLTVGFFYALFRKIKGQPVQVGDIGKGFNFFVASLLSYILISFFTSIGFLLCIIPGFIVTALYIFTPAFIADKNMDFWEAMEASRKLVSQHLFEMVIFTLVLILISIAGILLCGIGLFITTPLCFAAIVIAYNELVGIETEFTE